MPERTLTHLRALEAESIHILREVAAEFQRPVMLYSIGKDSSVMVRLAQKAFYPGNIPFPLLHIDTTYKFQEMIEFRDRFCAAIGRRADRAHQHARRIDEGANPFRLGTQKCCGLLKTRALLDALERGRLRRGLRRSAPRRGKVARQGARLLLPRLVRPVGSRRTSGPELWNLFNSRIDKGESIRVFPLSNWTELDVWHYIHLENIPIVPLVLRQGAADAWCAGDSLIPVEQNIPLLPGEKPQW